MVNDKNMLLLRKSDRKSGSFGARIRFNGNYPDPYKGPSPLGREVMNQNFAGHFGAMRHKSNFGRSRGAFGQTVGIATIQPMTARPVIRRATGPQTQVAQRQPAPINPGTQLWQGAGGGKRFDNSAPLSPIAGGCVEEPSTIFRSDNPNNPEHGLYLEDKYQVTFFDSPTGRRAQVVYGVGNFDANVMEFPVCPPRTRIGFTRVPNGGPGPFTDVECIDTIRNVVIRTDGTEVPLPQDQIDNMIATGRHNICDIPPPPPELPDCCLNSATGMLECATGEVYPVIIEDMSTDGLFAVVTLDINIDLPPTFEVPVCPPNVVIQCPPGFTVDANGICQPPPPPPPPPGGGLIPQCPAGMKYNPATGMCEPPPPPGNGNGNGNGNGTPGRTPEWPCVQNPPDCINWRGTRPGECYKVDY